MNNNLESPISSTTDSHLVFMSYGNRYITRNNLAKARSSMKSALLNASKFNMENSVLDFKHWIHLNSGWFFHAARAIWYHKTAFIFSAKVSNIQYSRYNTLMYIQPGKHDIKPFKFRPTNYVRALYSRVENSCTQTFHEQRVPLRSSLLAKSIELCSPNHNQVPQSPYQCNQVKWSSREIST